MTILNNNFPIIIAAGGTGGHIFPAQALSDALINIGKFPILICDERAHKFLRGSFLEIEKLTIFSTNFSGGFLKKFFDFFKLLRSIYQVYKFLKLKKVKKVIGFGGYPSFPTLIAAKLLRLDIYLHEQNAKLVRANKIFASDAKKIFTSFPKTLELNDKYSSKIYYVGNFLRSDVLKISQNVYNKIDEKFTILITGGSQGTKIFSEIIPSAIKQLPQELQKKLNVFHQVRNQDVGIAESIYRSTSVQYDIKPFFEDIADFMVKADLIICRSGASTITELISLGCAAILVPFILKHNDAQVYNAQYLIDNNAGYIINQSEFSIQNLTFLLKKIIADPNELENTRKNILKLRKNDTIELVLKELFN